MNTLDNPRPIVPQNEINPGMTRKGKTVRSWRVTDTSPHTWVRPAWASKTSCYQTTIDYTDGTQERVYSHG